MSQTTQNELPELLTVAQAAQARGVTTQAIYNLIKSGTLSLAEGAVMRQRVSLPCIYARDINNLDTRRSTAFPREEQEALLVQGLKRCSGCKDARPVAYFASRKGYLHGLYSICNRCRESAHRRKAYIAEYNQLEDAITDGFTSPITGKKGFSIVRNRATSEVRAARLDKPLPTSEYKIVEIAPGLKAGQWVVHPSPVLTTHQDKLIAARLEKRDWSVKK